MSACRSCGAPIVWDTLAGRAHPFNEDGKTSHFSTCPQAEAWRPKVAETKEPPAQRGLLD